MKGMTEAQRQMMIQILKEAEEKGEKIYVIDPKLELVELKGKE